MYIEDCQGQLETDDDLMNLRDLPGFSEELMRCSFPGHDHSSGQDPVIVLIAERTSGYGKKSLQMFHCPNCGVLTNERLRSEQRRYASVHQAFDIGESIPCGSCFPALSAFFLNLAKQRRQ